MWVSRVFVIPIVFITGVSMEPPKSKHANQIGCITPTKKSVNILLKLPFHMTSNSVKENMTGNTPTLMTKQFFTNVTIKEPSRLSAKQVWCIAHPYKSVSGLINTTTKNKGNPCHGRKDMQYHNPYDRHSFYSCGGGITYIQQCPSNLAYKRF
jgi:hypothetical protein